MSLITISRGTFSGGRDLAVRLAKELGYAYLSQEELSAAASEAAVPVERLRDAMLRPPREYERVILERDQYLTCLTTTFCEKALAGDLVYFGHLGHMLLPRVPNILRVRVLADMEYRIRAVIESMGYGRHEAKEHIAWVDTTRDKWIRFLYGVDWHDPLHYDIIINLAHTGMDAAVSAVQSMARQDEFRFTDHATNALRDMHLAAKIHFALLSDDRTRCPDIHVTANGHSVTVVYHPRSADSARHVEAVIGGMTGIHDLNVIIANGSLLYIMESCDSETVVYEDILRVADRLDAAVELMIVPPNGLVSSPIDDSHFGRCLEELRGQQRFGGWSAFYGTPINLMTSLQRRTPHRLVVLGNLFARQAPEIRARKTDEIKNRLADNITIPVIASNELHRYLTIDSRHIFRLTAFGLLAAALIVALFVFQKPILHILGPSQGLSWRLLAVLIVAAATPLFAFAFGSFTRGLLHKFGLD